MGTICKEIQNCPGRKFLTAAQSNQPIGDFIPLFNVKFTFSLLRDNNFLLSISFLQLDDLALLLGAKQYRLDGALKVLVGLLGIGLDDTVHEATIHITIIASQG